MDNKGENFKLDQSAAQLYRQFAGIDEQNRVPEPAGAALVELLNQKERFLDRYRLLLAEATILFVGVLANSRFAALAETEENEQKIKVLITTLKKIARFPKFAGKIHGRLRGQQCPDGKIGTAPYDYELSFGNFLLDFQVARIAAEREKTSAATIYTKLMEAFRALSAMEIFNFTIDLGTGTDEDYQRIENNIHHLVHFYASKGTAGAFLVKDEYGLPHLNLTLLAATNKIEPVVLQNLVDKLKPRLLGDQPDPQLGLFTTAYEAILASPRNRQLLEKMPIEVNNVEWLTRGLHATAEKRLETVQLSRFVMAKYGSNPRMAVEVLASINREGYTDIHPEVMNKRLTAASDFLQQSADASEGETLHHEALQNIEAGMEQVADSVYDNISIRDGEVSSVNAEGHKSSWSLHEKILGLLRFFKQRSTTKKKMRQIANRKVMFDSEDYAVIAKNFNISELSAAHLLELLKSCFDDLGHFRRAFFEKNIPAFVSYGTKVFEFLWHYLKELPSRNDRVAFLNAMQPLVAGLSHPREALKILLADVFNRSAVVKFSDRNGLMLATMLLRHNSRQDRNQIEVTPEDLLKIRQEFNPNMLNEVLGFLEQNQEYVLQKFRTSTEVLFTLAAQEQLPEGEMTPRFLLHLQREMIIFLAMVGGESALAIIQGMVREFGNPNSNYYQTICKKETMRQSLQLLQVAVRCLRRFDDPGTPALIEVVVKRARDFIFLCEDPAHHAYVKSVIEHIRQSD